MVSDPESSLQKKVKPIKFTALNKKKKWFKANFNLFHFHFFSQKSSGLSS